MDQRYGLAGHQLAIPHDHHLGILRFIVDDEAQPGESGPVAQFMYQCKQGTRVTLYMRTEGADHEQTAFRYSDEGNVRVFYWIDRTFGYAVSSADIDKDVLFKVANTAYAQLNP